MSSEELLWHVDKDDNPIGSITRDHAHKEKTENGDFFIHRAVLIFLRDEDNNFLLQKRAANKQQYPNHWTVSASGHVTYPETYTQAARREISEEIGLSESDYYFDQKYQELVETPDEVQYVYSFTGKINSEDSLSINKGEVAELRKFSFVQFVKLFREEEFTAASKSFLTRFLAETYFLDNE